MLETLMHSPIAWAILAVITIISLAYAIICNQKNKEKKEFSYCLRSRTLIRKKKAKFEKLSIVYGGKQIDDLCVSNFTIWNSGNKTLNASDMVTSKELTITALEDGKILDVEILKCSEETNKFSLQLLDEHTVKILFDYVDKMEGVVIQIIHTGTNDSLEIDCKIKGGRPVNNYINDRLPQVFVRSLHWSMGKKGFAVNTILMVMILLYIGVKVTIAIWDKDLSDKLFPVKDQGSSVFNIFKACFVWLYFLFVVMLFTPLAKIKYKVGMPSKLKRYSGFDD